MKRIAEENAEMSVGERLSELEKELRRTLSLKDADHNKCIKVLQDITDLSLTPAILMKNKTIIPTMKKVILIAYSNSFFHFKGRLKFLTPHQVGSQLSYGALNFLISKTQNAPPETKTWSL